MCVCVCVLFIHLDLFITQSVGHRGLVRTRSTQWVRTAFPATWARATYLTRSSIHGSHQVGLWVHPLIQKSCVSFCLLIYVHRPYRALHRSSHVVSGLQSSSLSLPLSISLRATPLLRAKVKITVNIPRMQQAEDSCIR